MLRDSAAEKRAKEKAEAPTVKTEEQMKADEKNAQRRAKDKAEAAKSIWKRKFRALPEEKAVDLFADVIGDSFILLVAGGLIMYEYFRSKAKPDSNAIKLEELKEKLSELDSREKELEEQEKKQRARVETLEQALEEMKRQTKEAKQKS